MNNPNEQAGVKANLGALMDLTISAPPPMRAVAKNIGILLAEMPDEKRDELIALSRRYAEIFQRLGNKKEALKQAMAWLELVLLPADPA